MGVMSNLAHSAVLALRRFAYAGHSVRQRRPRLGLALAGGFARGIAHVGVLRAFEEFGVRIDCIAGTSVGALIGSAYAAGATLEEMEVMAGSTQFKDFARWTFSWMGLATNERLETYLRHFTEKTRFEEMRIPLAISATDVLTGESVYLTKGLLGPALRASCAYPGLFLPVEYEGRTLVDGFLTAPVPVEGARMLGAERVIAVYLDPGIVSKPKNMVDVINRSFSILQKQSQAEWRNQADIVIEPDVRGIRWDEFARSPDMIAAGEQAARAAMPAIRAMLAEPVMLQEAADTA